MSAYSQSLPIKTRELRNHHMDSTTWNGFPFRDDDIIVGTYGKAGTTWTQQIIAQLVFDADEAIEVQEISPWWDFRITPREARQALLGQAHRRIIKTHLPADALVMSDKAKYVYVARDGRDVIWSMYNHHVGFIEDIYDKLNGPGLIGDPLPRPDPDIRNYFRTWLEKDGYPFWSFWENTATWWSLRNHPNVMLLHFNRLKTDLAGEMRKLATFLGIHLPEEKWPAAVEHCTFEYMKAHAERYAPMRGQVFQGGARTFINKGTNGRWRDVLLPEDSLAYEDAAANNLGTECARWLMTGEANEGG